MNSVIMSEKSQWIIRIVSINVARMANALNDLVNNPKFISVCKFRKPFEKDPNESVM